MGGVMNKFAVSVFLVGLFLCADLGAAIPGEKKTQLSLGLNVVVLSASYGSE
jgi:hypothetical protein